MANDIASDVLLVQIVELRQRLAKVELERDALRKRALEHAQQHRAYKCLARDCQARIAELRCQGRRQMERIGAIERYLQDAGRGGKVAYLRPPSSVTRPRR